MCDRCANVDYPIGDAIWLPCGGPAARYPGKRKPMAFGDEDLDAWTKIQRMAAVIKKQRDEINSLKAMQEPQPKEPAFEGADGI